MTGVVSRVLAAIACMAGLGMTATLAGAQTHPARVRRRAAVKGISAVMQARREPCKGSGRRIVPAGGTIAGTGAFVNLDQLRT